MSFGTALVILALIWAVSSLLHKRHDTRIGRAPDDRDRLDPPARETEMQREVEELRERVRVLERIATDDTGSRRLSAEIERLRDE